MRELKFRAWHKNNECICENVTTDLLDRDYLEFMQYTGLKDKSGKEIYEGDIVKRTSMTPGGIDFIGAVIYELSGFALENGEESIYLFSEIDELEIIGNIYENPDLLK